MYFIHVVILLSEVVAKSVSFSQNKVFLTFSFSNKFIVMVLHLTHGVRFSAPFLFLAALLINIAVFIYQALHDIW